MNRDLKRINEAWQKKRPERGHFELKQFTHGYGWLFKAEAPMLDNFVGFRDGYEDEEKALKGLKFFVRRILK